MHMVAHGSRNTYTARWAFNLKPCRDIHRIPVKVGAIGNSVPNVDTYAEAHGSIGRLDAIVTRNLLLHPHSTTYRAVNAIEHDEQGIAPGLGNSPAMLLDR